MKREIADVLPYLEDGAYFVMERVYNTRNHKIHRVKIRLKQPDGRYFDGAWGNPKKKLDRLGRLIKVIRNGEETWELKKAQE